MSSSPIKTFKITAVKVDLVMKDICRIISQIESPYTLSKRKLTEARALLYIDTKRAFKLINSAHSDVVEESK